MPELKKFGDPEYGPYGYGFCNPAFYTQEPVTNDQYIATIHDDDPWKPAILLGAAKLDLRYPGWQIAQIKEKFGQCRFYADPPEWTPEREYDAFQQILMNIEHECDEVTERSKR